MFSVEELKSCLNWPFALLFVGFLLLEKLQHIGLGALVILKMGTKSQK